MEITNEQFEKLLQEYQCDNLDELSDYADSYDGSWITLYSLSAGKDKGYWFWNTEDETLRLYNSIEDYLEIFDTDVDNPSQWYEIFGIEFPEPDEATGEEESVRIFVRYCYSEGTYGCPTDGFVRDDEAQVRWFSYEDAIAFIEEEESVDPYYLSHGEMGRPSYKIVV